MRTGRGKDGLEPQERPPRIVGAGAGSGHIDEKLSTKDVSRKKGGIVSFLKRLFGR
jgi:hypothetical protein